MTTSARSSSAAGGYSLFEILLALGIVAILLGTAVPMIGSLDWGGGGEGPEGEIVAAVRAVRAKAVETGETRLLRLDVRGLESGVEGVPSVELPEGWRLLVMRFTERRFRDPGEREFWAFNGAGICEPLSLMLDGEEGTLVLRFDPLTGEVLPDDRG
jgi:hypothetical protein